VCEGDGVLLRELAEGASASGTEVVQAQAKKFELVEKRRGGERAEALGADRVVLEVEVSELMVELGVCELDEGGLAEVAYGEGHGLDVGAALVAGELGHLLSCDGVLRPGERATQRE
jgi:hypothetical protein